MYVLCGVGIITQALSMRCVIPLCVRSDKMALMHMQIRLLEKEVCGNTHIWLEVLYCENTEEAYALILP